MAEAAKKLSDNVTPIGKDQTADKISGGHLVAKALKAEGIDVVWTLCGGHIIDTYMGCTAEGIRIVDVRHEQTAAHAADGYARLTGRPGCAIVTAGPGTTDAITGVANAFRAESPMLLIGGQGALDQHRMGSLQDLPHVDIMKPITKFASSVLTTERIPDMISMAFRESVAGAPGPSFLEIPRDILDNKVDPAKVRMPKFGHYRASTRSLGDPDDIQKLADLIVAAKKPAILLGGQVWTCRATDAAIQFVKKLNIPAYVNGAGRGTLPPGDAHGFSRTRSYAFSNADLIVIVGTPFDFRMGYGRRLSNKAKVVQIDLEYRTAAKNRDVDLPMVGDCGVILGAVLQATTGRVANGAKERQAWLDELRAAETKAEGEWAHMIGSDKTPIHPLRLAKEIQDFMTENTIFIGDGGDVVTNASHVVKPKSPGHWMDPGPLGTLGVGTPFAMAAKHVFPKKEVLVLFGDGTFGMTGFDMATAVHFNLPFIGVVGNNSCHNQIRFGQIGKYGRQFGDIGNKLGDVEFSKFAQMLGGYGEEVRDPAQIGPALRRARDSGKAALINVWIDPEAVAPGTANQTMYK